MVAVPAATAVTRPVAFTVAAAVLLELQLTIRPVSALPLASFVTAVSCCVGVIPSTRVAEDGLTVTVATGTGFTVIAGVGAELTDSLVAVIVAVPTPTAVTVAGEPFALTVSTAVLLDTQVIVRPVRMLPFASLTVAVSCCASFTIIGVTGAETVTLVTGAGVTVSVALPVFPSLIAMIWTEPGATAVTRPADDTVATAVLPELHEMLRPVRIFPEASRVVAVACVV